MTLSRRYLAPETLEEAARVLTEGDATVLAGGTDLLPRWSRGLTDRPNAVVSLESIGSLKGISMVDGEVCVGACTTMSEIARDPTVRSSAPVLAEAAGRIACPQVRNRATIGGNLCNASPAADTAIPLILLDAVLDVASCNGTGMTVREVSITDFFHGPGSTALKDGEILTRIRFKPVGVGVHMTWEKFGTRPAMEIAVASVGVAIRVEAGKVTHARVGYGSVAPTPLRGRGAEAELMGRKLADETIEKCKTAAVREIAPIADVRASADYRREITGLILGRMLEGARSD